MGVEVASAGRALLSDATICIRYASIRLLLPRFVRQNGERTLTRGLIQRHPSRSVHAFEGDLQKPSPVTARFKPIRPLDADNPLHSWR
jgi:hypothetical protein